MNSAFETLTDKEKETLRLVLRGHDAKSMASELDLSVHTVNDRLRAARRKLGVTSSKEAARLLLEEEGIPELFADKALGSAAQSLVLDGELPPEGSPFREPGFRQIAAWTVAGVLALSVIAILLAFSAQTGPFHEIASREAAQTAQADTPNSAATERDGVNQTVARDAERESSARAWLALVDANDWQGSYDAAGAAFRKPNTVQDWRSASQQARIPLGKVLRRQAISFQSINAPPNGYVVVQFRTDFENRESAIESVTMEREDGLLRVVGYYIT